MGTFSPTHWFIVLVMITPLMALLVVPTWRILQRAGFNGAWALLMLVPVVGLLVPWVVSFLKWPNDREQRTSTSKGGVIAGIVLLPVAVGVLALVSKSAMGPIDVAGRPVSAGRNNSGAISQEKVPDAQAPSNPFSDPNYGKELLPKSGG